jgi:hypothetical protein
LSVYTKLNEAREKFHELKLEKTGHNKFAGYYYFELGDFLIPALKIFNDVGLCAVVSFDKEVATMTIVDVELKSPTMEGIRITSPLGSAALKGCHEIQNIGACETYCRRYLWVAALEIVEHDALDATTGKAEVAKSGANKSFKVSGPEEAFKSLQPEMQDLARKVAPKVDGAMPDVAVAMERISWFLDNFEPDDRTDAEAGLYYLLDSKTRSAIKAAQAAPKV